MNDDKILAHATASTIALLDGELPRDVQWMPPGHQVVQPMGFDEPFEMEITPAIAAAADRDLQTMRAQAAAGADAVPYGDFNHKDEQRSFKPLKFYWGGGDPKDGGVRMEVAWTGAGAQAVKDGSQTCISPSWMLNKVTKAFLGIAHNVGGLVPRSAFHSIQAFAKAEALNNNNPTESDNTMNAEKEAQAASAAAFRKSADAADSGTIAAHKAAAIAHQNAADLFGAIPHQDTEQGFAQGMHTKLFSFHDDKTQDAPSGSPEKTIEAKAKSYGAQRGITCQAKALEAYLHSREGQADYERYRHAVLAGSRR